MTQRTAWFCPSCNKHHAPHCDTCPGPVDLIGQPMPAIPWPAIPPSPILPWQPAPDTAPWTPYYPVVTSATSCVVGSTVDPSAMIWN